MPKEADARRTRAGVQKVRAARGHQTATAYLLTAVFASLLSGAGAEFSQARPIERTIYACAATNDSDSQKNALLAPLVNVGALTAMRDATSDAALLDTADVIIGSASMYNPYDADDGDAGGIETASGEFYDPFAWTAAIKIDLRDAFGGINYGRDYRPTFALVEGAGKSAIVRINDVGPLRPGRVIDFSQRAMRYFDPTMQRGVIHSVVVTPLVGSNWTQGPLDMAPPLITVTSNAD